MIATNLDNSENSVQTHSLKLPGLEISNEDSGLSKWMLPALMLDDDLSSEFIENNVYISAFRILAFEGSAKTTFLSFTVSYSIDDERMTKSYRIEDDGLISIIIEPDHPKNEPLLLASDFMKLFKQMDKNDIVEYAGSKHSIVIAEFEKLARLDPAGIPEDRMVIYKDSLVPFDEIRSDGQQAICYTTFHVNGKGVQLPLVFQLK